MTRFAVSRLVLIVSAVVIWSSGVALAKPKVALTEIEGDASGDVRDSVVEALEGKELSLISGKEVNRAVDKLGDLADFTEKDLKKLATQLEADAIVIGKLDKVGGSKTLKFKLFVRKKMAKGFTMSFKDAKSEKFRTLLHDKMIDKLGIAAGAGEDEAEDAGKKKKAPEDEEDPLATKAETGEKGKKGKKAKVEDEEEVKPAKKAKPEKLAKLDEEEVKPTKKAKLAEPAEGEEAAPKKTADDEEAAPADDEANPSEDDEPRKAKKKVAAAEDGDEVEGGVSARVERPRGANQVAIRLDVGVSLVQRSYTFNSKIAGNPKNVSLSPVPGARIEAEVYPLALTSPGSMLAGLGLGVDYDKTVKLNVTTMGATVPVKQSHYSIGVRYRLALGSTETSPTLTVGVGYGKRLFSPDRGQLADEAAKADLARNTPTTQYVVIDPSLAFRMPVTRMIAFFVDGRGLLITNAGPIQGATSYGQAKVYGVDASAGVDVVLGKRFAVRFAGEFTQIGLSFTGNGELSNNLDGDPTTKDVGGLADRSLGGSATFAVLY